MNIDKVLILNKIKDRYDFKSDASFARFLGISPQTLQNWYQRNTWDWDKIYTKCVDLGLNIDELIKGESSSGKDRDFLLKEIASKNEIIAAKEEVIKLLRAENERLKNDLERSKHRGGETE